jgi:hypothetical protein
MTGIDWAFLKFFYGKKENLIYPVKADQGHGNKDGQLDHDKSGFCLVFHSCVARTLTGRKTFILAGISRPANEGFFLLNL